MTDTSPLLFARWQEFLLFLLPLINLHRFRLRVTKAISSRAKRSSLLRGAASTLPAPIANSLGLSSLRSSAGSNKSDNNADRDSPPAGPYAFLPDHTCPICYSTTTGPPAGLGSASAATAFADPTLPSASALSHTASGPSGGAGDTAVKIPYVANCRGRCRYCYYCIVGTLVRAEEDADDSWTCLRCGDEITAADREVPVPLPAADEDDREEDDDGTLEESPERVNSKE